MEKNFEGIDIFFIVIISIYLLVLIIFITVFLFKYHQSIKKAKLTDSIKEDKPQKYTSKKSTQKNKINLKKKKTTHKKSKKNLK